MATATLETKLIKEKFVNLRLTDEEAITLRHILAKVGGGPDTTYRKYSDTIGSALENLGYESPSTSRFDRNFYGKPLEENL